MKILAALALLATTGTGLATVKYGSPPPDFTVPTHRGNQPLSQLRGKPIVINFWASWCPPCTEELPYFTRVEQTYGDRIRLVTIDWNEPAGVAAAYLKNHGLALPLVEDPQSKIYAAYSLDEVPDTVVLDANGAVTYVSVGELSWKELQGAVDQALAVPVEEPSASP